MASRQNCAIDRGSPAVAAPLKKGLLQVSPFSRGIEGDQSALQMCSLISVSR